MLNYHMPLYRPPSEARSLIIQVTLGCSYNACTFCSMYKSKQFQARSLEDIQADLLEARQLYPHVRRIFLADGDALVLSTEKLVAILDSINNLFPEVERISAYATARNILGKEVAELEMLKSKKLTMVYMGLESGDEDVLKKINKGETAADIIASAQKVMAAGLVLSMTVISGLGGVHYKEAHAIHTAQALSQIKPHYIGFLALMIEPGTPLYEEHKKGDFTPLSPLDIVDEMMVFLKHIDSEGSIFRCNHASNYFSLAGVLNQDIPLMLSELEEVRTDIHQLKQEQFRRL